MPGEVFSYTLKEPVGVVAAINPWNGPIGLAIWKICPVLATGCTVVLKPAEQAPLSPLRLAELCIEAGVPPGVVNVISGLAEAAAALAAHPGVDKVAFTGSTDVGQKIVRASAGNLKRMSMELGGKSPNIVFADADLDAAVPGAAMAVFQNSGQICSAGTRLYVQRPIYDEFVEKVAAYVAMHRGGQARIEAQQADRAAPAERGARDRPAHVQRIEQSQLVVVLLDQIGQLQHHLLAVERPEAAPRTFLERAARGGDRAIDIGRARLGNVREPLAGGRVESIEHLAAGSRWRGVSHLVSKPIKQPNVLGFADLGMEAIYEFDVKNMPFMVAFDRP